MRKFYDAEADFGLGGSFGGKAEECPHTKHFCHDPLCSKDICIRQPVEQSERTWRDLMKKFNETPYTFEKSYPQPVHVHIHNDFGPLLEVLLSINQKLNKTMATIEEVQQAVADLQATVDQTQAAIAAAIKALEDQIAAGSVATPEQLQAVIDSLRAVQTDVSNTPTS